MTVDPDIPPTRAHFEFDTLDVPPDRFLVAGDAWLACRRGDADPVRFGLPGFPDNGLGWIASELVRDLACLNKRELLCWNSWALGHTAFEGISDEEAALLDHVANMTRGGCNEDLRRIQALHREDRRLTVPPVIKSLDHSVAGSYPLVEVSWAH